jgi:hypothetical protein
VRYNFKVLFFSVMALVIFLLPNQVTKAGYLDQRKALKATTTNDFVVSTDSTEGLRQNYSATATDRTSRFVIVWEDERSGWGEFDIYAQLFSLSGTRLGNNFKVNTDAGTSVQEYPSVSMDESGNFIVVWADWRNDNSDIYAQRFSSGGSPIDTNFRVDDDISNGGQYAPDVVMNYHTGSFVITWMDERDEEHFEVRAQRFKPNGDTLGVVLIVNDQDIGTSLASPAIAMDDSGNFVITWDDHRDIDYDIFAQYYFSDGSFTSVNWMVGDATD